MRMDFAIIEPKSRFDGSLGLTTFLPAMNELKKSAGRNLIRVMSAN